MIQFHKVVDGVAVSLGALAIGLTLAKVALVMTILAAGTSFIIGCIRICQWAATGKLGDL